MPLHCSSIKRPALFLDRDGVINVETNYVCRIDDFVFIDGIFDLCRSAVAMGMAIVVVTNQAGIGRGYYTEAQFHELSEQSLGVSPSTVSDNMGQIFYLIARLRYCIPSKLKGYIGGIVE